MKKYNIEGGIDFFTELYKSLDKNENENKNININTDNDENFCLISNQPLIDKYVTLLCGHKFNYIPLYKDLVNHKKKFNGMEATSGRLKQNEIRCPYCRKKQNDLLPYYGDLDIPKIAGINTFSVNYNQSYNSVCEFVHLNPKFNPDGDNPVDYDVYNNGNCKYIKCTHMGTKINTTDVDINIITFMQDKYYCWIHKKQMLKQYKKDQTEKIKEEKKKALLENKQKLKEEKKAMTIKLKEEKKKLILENKQKLKENTIISSDIVITIDQQNELVNNLDNNKDGCISILKTGLNKGKICGCKISEDFLCKRHFNLINNK